MIVLLMKWISYGIHVIPAIVVEMSNSDFSDL